MTLKVGVPGSAGGDGVCTGYITEKTTFTADSLGSFEFDLLSINVNYCGYILPSIGSIEYKNSSNIWTKIQDISGGGYYGYEFWSRLKIANVVGTINYRIYFNGDFVYFTGQSSIITQPKYRCISGVCTRDDVNGTFTESTCGGTCTTGCTSNPTVKLTIPL